MFNTNELNDKLVSELREIAKSFGVENTDALRKAELIIKINEQQDLIKAAKGETAPSESVIENNNTTAESSEEEKPKKRARTTVKALPVERKTSAKEEVSLFDAPYSTSEILPTNEGPEISVHAGVTSAVVNLNNLPKRVPTKRVVEAVVYGETAKAVGGAVKSGSVKLVLLTKPDLIFVYLLILKVVPFE